MALYAPEHMVHVGRNCTCLLSAGCDRVVCFETMWRWLLFCIKILFQISCQFDHRYMYLHQVCKVHISSSFQLVYNLLHPCGTGLTATDDINIQTSELEVSHNPRSIFSVMPRISFCLDYISSFSFLLCSSDIHASITYM